MKRLAVIFIIAAGGLWLMFTAFLLGKFTPGWMAACSSLSLPKTTADFGQSFTALDGLLSSLALVLALLAVLVQVRQQADSNTIGAFGARLQFLLAECERLEQQIKELKSSKTYDENLFDNMVAKKSRLLTESQNVDKRVQDLLKKI